MEISAQLIKELRERTGSGFMECKKALVENNGDLEKAIMALRKAGQAKAEKKSARVAAEGMIAISVSKDQKRALMLEANCETDFVARDQNFQNFVNLVSTEALNKSVKSLEELNLLEVNGKSVSKLREDLVAKIGENINLRRVFFLASEGVIGNYLHQGKIGVLVSVSGGDQFLAKDIAMQIAANNPLAVSANDLPKEIVDREREIYLAQVQSSGKSPEILEKMVNGKLQKFVAESTLLGQVFIKDSSLTISQLLEKNKAKVFSFKRFMVGEGIEKVTTDFAKEVEEQVSGRK
jgi:elongation factor Ts